MPQYKSENRLCELLHIDTQDSQKFFLDHKATHEQKCECQKVLEDIFTVCCRSFGGRVRFNGGDGGLAYFDAGKFSGGSIRAAERFFSELPELSKQTARVLHVAKLQRVQRFRLKGHFGPVYIDADRQHLASAATVIDSFVKKERNIAPLSDQLYITDELLNVLGSHTQSKFSRTSARKQKFGHLSTTIHRLRKRPPDSLPKPPNLKGRRVSRKVDITRAELNYLKRSVETQVISTAARNSITIGLTRRLATERRAMRSTDLVQATLEGFHAFLVSACSEITETFNVTFWQPNRLVEPTHLRKQWGFPKMGPKRTISLQEDQFQVVRSFTECTAIFHEDVRAAAANREWVSFDPQQGKRGRNLFSAVQFPIYRNRNEIGKRLDREQLGVLSIDTNCPEFFHPEDAALWTDRIKGFLVNLALSQVLEHPRLN
jgi:hypothetical protein